MARVTTTIDGAADQVWKVLADGWSYSNWVVGTVRIRTVDADFPAVGSKLHHAVGAWPLLLKDETEVIECEPGRRLLLQARGWPMGEATVELLLHDDGAHSRVEMYEEPTSGPGAWLSNPVLDKVGEWRLVEALDRLKALVERRPTAA